jgi:hypothetical protein
MRRVGLVRIKSLIAITVAAAGATLAPSAQSEPLRLRADALVQSRTPAPVGLLVLRGEDKLRPWIDAEAVTWMGVTDQPGATGDVLSLSVRMRDAKTGSEVRAGRMLVSMGAVRPLQIDGARGMLRVFDGTTIESFGGFPVVRRFDYRAFEWAGGGRVGQSLGDQAAFGASYLHRRSDGRPADEEAGADLGYTPSRNFTFAGRTAFDLVTRGPTDALASMSVQNETLRTELFTTHRSPGRLLPSTSLFSVLGDYAATSFGLTQRWRAFPRLELLGTGSGQIQGVETGYQATARTSLALDDEWAGTLGLEARRVDFGRGRWSGARALVSVPLRWGLRAATELELVVPDDSRNRGDVWPWALGSIGWRSTTGWEAAAGVEGSSGPENRSEVHALARLSYAFERSR